MYIFGNDKSIRGCYSELRQGGVNVKGAILSMFDNGASLGAPITGVQFNLAENIGILPCLGDNAHIYAFGRDVQSSRISVTFMVFLIGSKDKSGAHSETLSALVTKYNESRISESPKEATLTLGHLAAKGYVVGMTSATANEEINAQSVTVELLVADIGGAANAES